MIPENLEAGEYPISITVDYSKENIEEEIIFRVSECGQGTVKKDSNNNIDESTLNTLAQNRNEEINNQEIKKAIPQEQVIVEESLFSKYGTSILLGVFLVLLIIIIFFIVLMLK